MTKGRYFKCFKKEGSLLPYEELTRGSCPKTGCRVQSETVLVGVSVTSTPGCVLHLNVCSAHACSVAAFGCCWRGQAAFPFLSRSRNPLVSITRSPLAVVDLSPADSSSPKVVFFSCKPGFSHVQPVVSRLLPWSGQPHFVSF